jgi:hypothetical protein
MNIVLLRYIPANNVMRYETKTFFGARANQRHKNSKKYDEKCSISNAHSRTAKYWTAGPVSPRVGIGIDIDVSS